MKCACLLVLCAAGLGACGSGGGGGAGASTVQTAAPVPQEQNAVVRLDINGDGEPDLLTVDRAGVIVAALESRPGGDPVDTTSARQGMRIDSRIAEALSSYLSDAVDLASETQLEVVDSSGQTISVVIFE